MLTIVLFSILLLCITACASAAVTRSARASLIIGTAGSVLACVAGGTASLLTIVNGNTAAVRWAWTMPLGEFHVAIDALSAFFLLCVFLVSGLAALYGYGYLRAGDSRNGHDRRNPAAVLFFFNLLIAAMALLIVARDGILFLLAWEAMTVASFFLVTHEHDRDEARRAGMIYLVASHLGAILIFTLFAILGRRHGGYDFNAFAAGGAPDVASLGFLLALAGFGVKAGFWPLHVWLPDAHPAAPSHVSAVMSGVMIKVGIYGFLRTLTFLGDPPEWWGIALIAVGAISGVLGILHALAQRHLKRLLAYSSVENVGVIALGIGIGLLGSAHDEPSVAFLGYAGALIHILNHGLFKGLLFQGAGSVIHATGGGLIDAMGGLGKRMPVTATTFFVAAVAICGLPPLNGFVGEWLIFVGAFEAGSTLPTLLAIPAILVVPTLALIGGLAAACFVKAFGVVFLGEPRRAETAHAHEAGPAMQTSMIAGTILCIVIGLWPLGVVRLAAPAASALTGSTDVPWSSIGPLAEVGAIAALLIGFILFFILIRRSLLRGRTVTDAATWGCGYDAPTPRMQYTAASFSEPILIPCAAVIDAHERREGPDGFFPTKARLEERVGDMAGERLIAPATTRLSRTVARLRRIQQGRLQLYIVYIALALVALLIWQIAGSP